MMEEVAALSPQWISSVYFCVAAIIQDKMEMLTKLTAHNVDKLGHILLFLYIHPEQISEMHIKVSSQIQNVLVMAAYLNIY